MTWQAQLSGSIETALASATAAAWAQTVAVGVGLFIAIWVPWLQRRNELRDRTNQQIDEATGLALVLMPAIDSYCAGLQHSLSSVDDVARAERPSYTSSIAEAQQQVVMQIRSAAQALPTLVERLEYLHRLGPLAQGAHELVHLSRSVDRGFHVAGLDANVPNVLPFDAPLVHSAIESARVLKARAFAVRDQFRGFLDNRLSGDLRPFFKQARRYHW